MRADFLLNEKYVGVVQCLHPCHSSNGYVSHAWTVDGDCPMKIA